MHCSKRGVCVYIYMSLDLNLYIMLYYRNVNHYFHPWLSCEINQVLLVYL